MSSEEGLFFSRQSRGKMFENYGPEAIMQREVLGIEAIPAKFCIGKCTD